MELVDAEGGPAAEVGAGCGVVVGAGEVVSGVGVGVGVDVGTAAGADGVWPELLLLGGVLVAMAVAADELLALSAVEVDDSGIVLAEGVPVLAPSTWPTGATTGVATTIWLPGGVVAITNWRRVVLPLLTVN